MLTRLESELFIYLAKHPTLTVNDAINAYMKEHPVTKVKEWDEMKSDKQNDIIAKLTKRWNNLVNKFPKQYGAINVKQESN